MTTPSIELSRCPRCHRAPDLTYNKISDQWAMTCCGVSVVGIGLTVYAQIVEHWNDKVALFNREAA